ncbi:hypothetical protein RIF29_24018 [Crotalaria pallida]|uniref:RRM domain-containing protein n=1 Tax=Crotalaria pallida TaxID=3830 RepID=A0AAN9EJR4_CROPI
MSANATATLSLCFPSSSSSSSSLKHQPQFLTVPSSSSSSKRCVSFSFSAVPPIVSTWKGSSRVLAAAVVAESVERQNDDVFGDDDEEEWRKPRATEVYVCNLPRSIDSEYLFDIFQPHANVLSVEVCRNAETGRSKGCAYVTLGSIISARNAVSALDGTDVGGREMRVRFSVEMNRGGRSNLQTMNSSPKRVIYYEGPYKLYVGNIPKATRPEELRYLFDQFGNVVSEFGGRKLVVREGVDRNETLNGRAPEPV